MSTVNADTIYFYRSGANYDIFSNVTDIRVECEISGKKYAARSTEALYQGLKAWVKSRKKAEALVLDQNPPGGYLQKKGQQFKNPIYEQSFKGNTTVKVQLMEELLLIKATQNIEIAKALLNSKTKNIIENTALANYNDSFWGNGLKGDGRNELGKAWMRVRTTLQTELMKKGFISVRTGLSDELANTLEIPNHRSNSQYHQNKVITQKDLNSVPVCTTVDTIHQARQKLGAAKAATSLRSQSASLYSGVKSGEPFLPAFHNVNLSNDPQSSFGRVCKATRAKSAELVPNKKNPSEWALRLDFPDRKSAERFAKRWKASSLYGNQVFLGKDKSRYIFDKLKIKTHGKTAHHEMFDALIYDHIHSRHPATQTPRRPR